MSPTRSVPAAAAAEAASTTAAAGAARAGPVGAGLGLVDRQGTALEVRAVEPGNGLRIEPEIRSEMVLLIRSILLLLIHAMEYGVSNGRQLSEMPNG
jgi:hypothetical protein